MMERSDPRPTSVRRTGSEETFGVEGRVTIVPWSVDAEIPGRAIDVIPAVLEEKALTRTQLADAIGMSEPTLASRLAGQTRFSSRELARIARYLGLKIWDLSLGDPQMKRGLGPWIVF
jgi:AraC-like DNA-binding protein